MPGSRVRHVCSHEFTEEEIEEAVRSSRLLAIEIELGPGGNARCSSGYLSKRSTSKNELSRREVREVILQARDLGARKVSILGGEARGYPRIAEMIRFVRSKGLEVEMLANGAGITADFARELFANQVRVVLKMDPSSQDAQDVLAVTEGRFDLVQQGFRHLKEAGYPSDEAPLEVGAEEPESSLRGHGCMQHKFSCLICSQGDVIPCVGLSIPIGNVREQRLYDILKDSEVLEDLRNYRQRIKGPCGACEEADTCYGCRGAAYRLTGDYLASDPLCWKNADRQNEIARLPFPIAGIIPQERPMRIIDDLLETGERSGEVSATVSDEMPFVDEDGALDEAAYFELMAQSIAALNGFKQLGGSESSSKGYLVGAQKIEILGTARVGDTLNIYVEKDVRFGKFAVVKGTVSRNTKVLARGEIKIWHDTEDVRGPAGPGD